MIVGYVEGSRISKPDEKNEKGEEHLFNEIIKEQVEYGAVPIWDTFRIFANDGMVFATVIVDIENVNDDWSGSIFGLNKDGFETN